ncbi:hypothetical protein GIB67_006578 [Kingdonia uniflora]|uniref:Protein kinase domain-containing protein n=1 Tax=Kingdonia uniflora TaxID=39325 RepID=A0A7J7LES8_9MAGN|nr:hypothetical protein GIB67_006578 [Kingdonia uniflora]
MDYEDVGPSGQRIPDELGKEVPSGTRLSSNVSVQTGEEFSLEFIQDRASSRRVSNVSDTDNQLGQSKKGGFSFSPNHQVGYEDLTGILGLRRMDSEVSYEYASDFAHRKGYPVEVDKSPYSDRISRYQKEIHFGGKDSGDSFDGMNFYRPNPHIPAAPPPPPLFASESLHGFPPYSSGTSDSSQPGTKMKFLCSFGGKILPRPSDGKLRYVGGETRIINIRRSLAWLDLVKKTSEICNQSHTIKYQLPGEDLDALISVSSDEDLQNMMEEYYGLERVDGQRLRIFLISVSESDSPCSFEARATEHNNSEYQYVVAVNGVMDRTPRKYSSGQNFPYFDGSSNYHKDSPPSNRKGAFSRNANPFLMAPQNYIKSPNRSPPNSPLPVQRADSKNAHFQLFDDESSNCSNESNNTLFVTADQPPTDNYFVDSTNFYRSPHGPVHLIHPHHHPHYNKPMVDIEKTNKPRGVHFNDWKHNREFPVPSALGRNNSDTDVYSCERPLLKERAFHSEKLLLNPEDPLGLLSGSNDSVESNCGMPHVLSDSRLQEHELKPIYPFQEGNTPISPLDYPKSQSPAWVNSTAWLERPVKLEENTEISDPKFQNKFLGTESIGYLKDLDLPKFAHFPERAERNEHIQLGSHDLNENDYSTREVPTLMSLDHYNINYRPSGPNPELLNLMDGKDSRPYQDNEHYENGANNKSQSVSMASSDEHPNVNYHLASVLPTYPQESQVPASSVATMKLSSDIQLDSTSELLLKTERKYSTEENSPIDPLSCGSSNDMISYDSPQPLPVTSQKEAGEEEPDNVAVDGNADLSLNMRANENSLTWSLFNSQIADAFLRREVSLLDEDPMSFRDQNVAVEVIHGGYPHELSDSLNVFDKQTQLESGVLVEDVTDTITHDAVQSSLTPVPHVQDEIPEDIESPRVSAAGSATPESDFEDIKADDRDINESISDAAIAEIEAGIYGLQIIKNADLEELRELGSGTFGTVYHGKWRGTDVAIKRIKKSCFAGRSSEQERLTKDFWREAQILSKLHHPNVVAFYGIVPDGAGGTLATVTEFMVNGSLRHVLLRKDRALDRRRRLIIAMDAAFGMEYLHSKNIVHFDLKCDNLLVNMRDTQRPICKVGDFGLSRIKRNTLVSGGVRGTLPWMAPELLNGSSSRVSEKVDVFSFGIAMWEILTGEEPYANMHCGAIIGGIVSNTLRPLIPDRCDSGWRKLMEQCWSPDPSARPSFTEITNRLRVMSMALQAKGLNQPNR